MVDLSATTEQSQLNARTLHQLRRAGHPLCLCGVVYSELHAVPGMTRAQLDRTLAAMGVAVDPLVPLPVWEDAGAAHAALSERRRRARVPDARRPLTDHLIGAHALHRAGALLTANGTDFRDFPRLTVIQA